MEKNLYLVRTRGFESGTFRSTLNCFLLHVSQSLACHRPAMLMFAALFTRQKLLLGSGIRTGLEQRKCVLRQPFICLSRVTASSKGFKLGVEGSTFICSRFLLSNIIVVSINIHGASQLSIQHSFYVPLCLLCSLYIYFILLGDVLLPRKKISP